MKKMKRLEGGKDEEQDEENEDEEDEDAKSHPVPHTMLKRVRV